MEFRIIDPANKRYLNIHGLGVALRADGPAILIHPSDPRWRESDSWEGFDIFVEGDRGYGPVPK